jgi:hypothetical protein
MIPVMDHADAMAEIQNMAKGGNFKANNTNKENEFMNTMASTRNVNVGKVNNKKSAKVSNRDTGVSPIPQYNAAQSHQKIEREIELDESRDEPKDFTYEIDEQANESVDHSEINQTAFPSGFPFCFCPSSDQRMNVHDKDPRSYQFVPQCWTKRIPAAGRNTFKGEPVYSILLPKNN